MFTSVNVSHWSKWATSIGIAVPYDAYVDMINLTHAPPSSITRLRPRSINLTAYNILETIRATSGWLSLILKLSDFITNKPFQYKLDGAQSARVL